MSVHQDIDTLQRATEWVNRRKMVRATGLELPATITADEHTWIAMFVGQLGDVSAWCRGDQVVRIQDDTAKRFQRGTNAYNDAINLRYQELLRLYRSVEFKTLLNNAATARTWHISTRRQSETIGYSHHEALNSRSREEREYYLDMAEAAGWTVSQLRAELYGQRNVVAVGETMPTAQLIAELFRRLDLPATVEAQRASWRTAQGLIVVESDSELRWKVEP